MVVEWGRGGENKKNVPEISRLLAHENAMKKRMSIMNERKTRLELATPTLARLCSTN